MSWLYLIRDCWKKAKCVSGQTCLLLSTGRQRQAQLANHVAAINAVVAPNSLAESAASHHSINSSGQLSSGTGAYPKQQPRQLSLDGGPACQTVLSLTELAAREVASSIPFELVERYYPPVPEQVQAH